MREYFGQSAKSYSQPQDKYFTLFPALDKALPTAVGAQSLIDLGCGTADLYEFITTKGYDYTGVDISNDMLKQARSRYPKGYFIQGDVTKSIPEINKKYDVVFLNMLFPSISSERDFQAVFNFSHKILADSGIIIIAAGHPCFDGYMQKHFFDREDIETTFNGYFKSGANYKVHRTVEKGVFTFSDHHWTLTDYFKQAKRLHLKITTFDECPLVGKAPAAVKEKIIKKGAPSYVVFVLERE
jgi:SAM-dependent methyltransferase